jgi:hypothetical protein
MSPETRHRIAVAIVSLGVVAAMGIVRFVMRTPSQRTELAVKATRPATAFTPDGPPCEIESSPPAATVYALRNGERAALGITPLVAPKADYVIRVELAGHRAAEQGFAGAPEPCRLHFLLEPDK